MLSRVAGFKQKGSQGVFISGEKQKHMEQAQILTSDTLVTNQPLTPPEPLTSWPTAIPNNVKQARRFLMVMLPSIPVIAFSVDFLYTYIAQARFALAEHQPMDEAQPFLSALLVAAVVSLLCIFIYQGVLRILADTQRPS